MITDLWVCLEHKYRIHCLSLGLFRKAMDADVLLMLQGKGSVSAAQIGLHSGDVNYNPGDKLTGQYSV